MAPLAKYVWLIELLQKSANGLTFEEINEKWLRHRRNTKDENIPILKRTFHNHINAIREEYGIHIVCGSGYRYYIEEHKKDINSIVSRLSVLNLLNESVCENKLGKSMFIEEYLDLFRDNITILIMDAIKARRKIKLDNRLFLGNYNDKKCIFTVAPLQLHQICMQWFLLGIEDELGLMRFPMFFYYGDVLIMGETFKFPNNYSPGKYGKMIYGKTKDRLQLTILLQNLFPNRIALNRFPLMLFQKKIEFGNWDKEGKNNSSRQAEYNTKITFDLPKTPLALRALERRISGYTHTVLNNIDPSALFTDDQYSNDICLPVVL